MNVTIDKAGRVVIPKPIRDRLGLEPGTQLVLSEVGSGVLLETDAGGRVVEEDGHLVIVGDGRITDDDVRALLDAIRR